MRCAGSHMLMEDLDVVCNFRTCKTRSLLLTIAPPPPPPRDLGEQPHSGALVRK